MGRQELNSLDKRIAELEFKAKQKDEKIGFNVNFLGWQANRFHRATQGRYYLNKLGDRFFIELFELAEALPADPDQLLIAMTEADQDWINAKIKHMENLEYHEEY